MSKILATLWFKWINQRQKIASLSRCINHVVKFKRYLHLGIAVSNFKSIVEFSIFDLKVWKSQPKETKVFFKNAYMRIKVYVLRISFIHYLNWKSFKVRNKGCLPVIESRNYHRLHNFYFGYIVLRKAVFRARS